MPLKPTVLGGPERKQKTLPFRFRAGLYWALPISAVLWIALIWFVYQTWSNPPVPVSAASQAGPASRPKDGIAEKNAVKAGRFQPFFGSNNGTR